MIALAKRVEPLPRVRILGYTEDGRPVTVTETEPHWTIHVPPPAAPRPHAHSPERARRVGMGGVL